MSGDVEGIVVLGVPRSGTTLLRRLLDAHPAIHSPPETNLLGAAGRFLAEQPSAGGLGIGVVPGLAFSGLDESQVLGRLREFVFGFFRELATNAGKPVWAEKTATDVFHVDAIERLCAGHCRFVLLTRHPLDVVCSIEELSGRMQLYMTELHEYVRRHAAPLEAFAHAWRDANERLLALEAAHPTDCCRIRYEDLVADPVAAMTRIFDFLGQPVDVGPLVDSALARTGDAGLGDWKTYDRAGVDTDSVGRGRALDPWLVGRLAAIVNPVMPLLGYEPIVPPPAPAQDVARRAYRIGRQLAAAKADRQKP
ncbi:MAG: sulfotransferase family protein [Sinimarinibacterium flocculans]|uniref:sulfotransferase family protein n=1 Tax=Sinimarinibacterium flocculans TaxID=985250 RepID=UPI002ECF9082|nr:sulfotransferase [Pseudomonadota bacterium]